MKAHATFPLARPARQHAEEDAEREHDGADGDESGPEDAGVPGEGDSRRVRVRVFVLSGSAVRGHCGIEMIGFIFTSETWIFFILVKMNIFPGFLNLDEIA